jgi:hypothetical protein
LTAAVQSNSENVDAWTRAFAADQARQAGVPLRDWLTQFVADQTGRPESESFAGRLGQTPASFSHDSASEPDFAFAESAGDCESPTELDHCSDLDAALAVGAAPLVGAARASPETCDVPDATEVARFAQGDDPVFGEWSSDDVAETCAPCDVGSDLPAESVVDPAPTDPTAPTAQLRDDEIEQALEGLSTRVDSIRRQMSAKQRQDSARRVESIERALRRMREELAASEQGDDSGVKCFANVAASQPNQALEVRYGAAGPVEHGRLEVDCMVEVVDRGFERIEAIGAKQAAELRSEIAQVFEALAARIDNIERPSIGPAEAVDRQPSPSAAPLGLDPFFEDTLEPVAAGISNSSDIAGALTVDSVETAAIPSPAYDSANSEPFDGADFDLADTNEDRPETTSAEPAPSDWPEPASGSTDPDCVAVTSDAPSDETSVTYFATEQLAEQRRGQASGQGKSSIFPRLRFGHGRLLRKIA